MAGFDLLSNYQLTMAALVLLLLTGLIRPLSVPVALPEGRSQRSEIRDQQSESVPPRNSPALVQALGEIFATIRLANTLMDLAGLVDPLLRVEIETGAVISRGNDPQT